MAPHRQPAIGGWPRRLLVWSPIAAGLIVLYLPSLVDLFQGIWSTDQQAHGPIVLGIACWLIYRKWPECCERAKAEPGFRQLVGPSFIFGLLLYVIGRSQDILIFEIGSVIWLLCGILLLIGGTAALKANGSRFSSCFS